MGQNARAGEVAVSVDKVNFAEKLARFADHWQPCTDARFNECDIMVVKVQG